MNVLWTTIFKYGQTCNNAGPIVLNWRFQRRSVAVVRGACYHEFFSDHCPLDRVNDSLRLVPPTGLACMNAISDLYRQPTCALAQTWVSGTTLI